MLPVLVYSIINYIYTSKYFGVQSVWKWLLKTKGILEDFLLREYILDLF